MGVARKKKILTILYFFIGGVLAVSGSTCNSGGGDEVSESTANRITELPQQSRPQRPQQQQQQQQQQLKNVLALQSACARVLKQTRQLDSILQQRQQRAEDIFVLDDDDNKNEAG